MLLRNMSLVDEWLGRANELLVFNTFSLPAEVEQLCLLYFIQPVFFSTSTSQYNAYMLYDSMMDFNEPHVYYVIIYEPMISLHIARQQCEWLVKGDGKKSAVDLKNVHTPIEIPGICVANPQQIISKLLTTSIWCNSTKTQTNSSKGKWLIKKCSNLIVQVCTPWNYYYVDAHT